MADAGGEGSVDKGYGVKQKGFPISESLCKDYISTIISISSFSGSEIVISTGCLGSGLGLFTNYGLSFKNRLIQSGDCSQSRIVATHFNKTKTFGSAGFPVSYNFCGHYLAIL